MQLPSALRAVPAISHAWPEARIVAHVGTFVNVALEQTYAILGEEAAMIATPYAGRLGCRVRRSLGHSFCPSVASEEV